jgi:hypothetical protein
MSAQKQFRVIFHVNAGALMANSGRLGLFVASIYCLHFRWLLRPLLIYRSVLLENPCSTTTLVSVL